MANNLLNGFYLMRVYSGEDPFATVTRLPRNEAIAVCEQTDGWRGDPSTPADAKGNRDQKAYMDMRLATDQWLRERAQAAGVRLDDPFPVYFSLTSDPQTMENFGRMKWPDRNILILSAAEVDLSHWSFTFDDSITNYSVSLGKGALYGEKPHPLHGTIMDAAQMHEAIILHGKTRNDGTPQVFEAQLWSDRISPALSMKKGQSVRPQFRSGAVHKP